MQEGRNLGQKIDVSDLYNLRMLVFLETEPQSNEYKQVSLSPEQYKKVSKDIVTKFVGRLDNKRDTCEVILSEEVYKLPDLPDMF